MKTRLQFLLNLGLMLLALWGVAAPAVGLAEGGQTLSAAPAEALGHVEVGGADAVLSASLSAFPADEAYGAFPRILEAELGSWEVRHTQYFNLFSEPEDRANAEFLADSVDVWLTEAMGRVGQIPGEDQRVDLFILPSAQAFMRFARQASGGRDAPAWAVGLAYPRDSAIFVKSPSAVDARSAYSLRQTTVHEIGHVVLGWAVTDGQIPRWLHEGLAKFIAGETTWEGRARLSQAVLTGGLIPLRELNRDFPRSASGAALAYAQSLEFLSWLMDEYGPGVIQGLIVEMGQGDSLETVIQDLTGQPLVQLEDAWHRHLRLNFAWLPALTTGGGIWVFASLILMGAWWRKRREREVRRERWAIEEALIYGPDPAWNTPMAFWAGGASHRTPEHLRVIDGGLSAREPQGDPSQEEGGDLYDDEGPPPGGWVH